MCACPFLSLGFVRASMISNSQFCEEIVGNTCNKETATTESKNWNNGVRDICLNVGDRTTNLFVFYKSFGDNKGFLCLRVFLCFSCECFS